MSLFETKVMTISTNSSNVLIKVSSDLLSNLIKLNFKINYQIVHNSEALNS